MDAQVTGLVRLNLGAQGRWLCREHCTAPAYVCSGLATLPLFSAPLLTKTCHVHSFIHWVTANHTVPFQIINSIAYSALPLNLLLGSVINKDMLLGEAVVLKIDHIPVSLQETEDPLRDKLSSPKMKSSITQATVPYLHAVQVHHPTQYGHFVHIRLGLRGLRSHLPFSFTLCTRTHQEFTCIQAAG